MIGAGPKPQGDHAAGADVRVVEEAGEAWPKQVGERDPHGACLGSSGNVVREGAVMPGVHEIHPFAPLQQKTVDCSLWVAVDNRRSGISRAIDIRGPVRRKAARKRQIRLHSWPGAEKLEGGRRTRGGRTAEGVRQEVQARHNRAYSPSAATSS